jgi:hypothetical protein
MEKFEHFLRAHREKTIEKIFAEQCFQNLHLFDSPAGSTSRPATRLLLQAG